MGGAPYIGPKLGDGPIFEIAVSHLYSKECPGKLPTLAVAAIDFSLIQARLPIQSKGGRDTSPRVVECSRIQWAWLRSLAVYDRLFVLKRGTKSARLSFSTLLIDLT